jgi:nitrile hydratase
MGGMHGMGAIQVEKNEPPFHARWEGRVLAMRRALGVSGKLRGNFRSFIESIPAADYLRMSYYEKWFTALVAQIIANGLATRAEIESSKPAKGSTKAKPALNAADAATLSVRAVPAVYHIDAPPRFQAGQRVRARNINPVSHTRLPRYTRGKTGVIERIRSVQAFPDSSALGQGDKPQYVYLVRFATRELWGEQASPHDSLYIDLWDDYLEPA